jgi:hypothetical protein
MLYIKYFWNFLSWIFHMHFKSSMKILAFSMGGTNPTKKHIYMR